MRFSLWLALHFLSIPGFIHSIIQPTSLQTNFSLLTLYFSVSFFSFEMISPLRSLVFLVLVFCSTVVLNVHGQTYAQIESACSANQQSSYASVVTVTPGNARTETLTCSAGFYPTINSIWARSANGMNFIGRLTIPSGYNYYGDGQAHSCYNTYNPIYTFTANPSTGGTVTWRLECPAGSAMNCVIEYTRAFSCSSCHSSGGFCDVGTCGPRSGVATNGHECQCPTDFTGTQCQTMFGNAQPGRYQVYLSTQGGGSTSCNPASCCCVSNEIFITTDTNTLTVSGSLSGPCAVASSSSCQTNSGCNGNGNAVSLGGTTYCCSGGATPNIGNDANNQITCSCTGATPAPATSFTKTVTRPSGGEFVTDLFPNSGNYLFKWNGVRNITVQHPTTVACSARNGAPQRSSCIQPANYCVNGLLLCSNGNGMGTCICQSQWTGARCDQAVTSNNNNNGGGASSSSSSTAGGNNNNNNGGGSSGGNVPSAATATTSVFELMTVISTFMGISVWAVMHG